MGKLRVKVFYRDQPLSCDICHGPHRVSDCDLRGKCRHCGEEGHFARACPRPWARKGDAASHVSDGADPTTVQAAGRATVADVGHAAASDANRAAVADAGRAAASDTDRASDAAVQAISEPDSLDGAMLDSSGRTLAISATLSASLLVDSHDNQLDEVSSQTFLSSPAPSSSDFDSLDGATVDSVGLNSPVPRDTSVSNLTNVDGVAKEGRTGLLSKLKTKVGLNKKKQHKEKVISTNESYITVNSGNSSNDSESILNDNVISVISNNESQKCAHPDSSEDTADSDHFSVPAKHAPHPPKVKPPVVVSLDKSRPVPVAEHDQERSRSRSTSGHSSSASRTASNGEHLLPSSIGYEPKSPRCSGGSKKQWFVSPTIMEVQIISINVNGIQNSDRRAGLLQWLRPLAILPDVVCLQEAHCVSDVKCHSWFRSSRFQSVVSPGSQKSCGYVILFRPSLLLVNFSSNDADRFVSEPDSLDGAMLDSSGRTLAISATLSASLLVILHRQSSDLFWL